MQAKSGISNLNRREFIFGSAACILFPTFESTFSTNANEILKCKDDIVYFAENYIKLPYRELVLSDWQKKYLRHLASGQDAVLCTYRQSGKTTLSMIYAVWKANFHALQNITIVTLNRDNECRIADEIRNMFSKLPSWMNSICAYPQLVRSSKARYCKKIYCKSDSSIVVASAECNFRGYAVGTQLIFDEFAFYSNAGAKNAVGLMSKLNPRGQILIASSPYCADSTFQTIVNFAKSVKSSKLFVVRQA